MWSVSQSLHLWRLFYNSSNDVIIMRTLLLPAVTDGGDDLVNLVAGVAQQGVCLGQGVILAGDGVCVSPTPDKQNYASPKFKIQTIQYLAT